MLWMFPRKLSIQSETMRFKSQDVVLNGNDQHNHLNSGTSELVDSLTLPTSWSYGDTAISNAAHQLFERERHDNNNLENVLKSSQVVSDTTQHDRNVTASTETLHDSSSSPEGSLFDYEEANHSCSSLEDSPQEDDDRCYELSEPESLSEYVNVSVDRQINNRLLSERRFSNDFEISSETELITEDVNSSGEYNANNNNYEENLDTQIDSVNKLNSKENIKKVFYDKPKFDVSLDFYTEKCINIIDANNTEHQSALENTSEESLIDLTKCIKKLSDFIESPQFSRSTLEQNSYPSISEGIQYPSAESLDKEFEHDTNNTICRNSETDRIQKAIEKISLIHSNINTATTSGIADKKNSKSLIKTPIDLTDSPTRPNKIKTMADTLTFKSFPASTDNIKFKITDTFLSDIRDGIISNEKQNVHDSNRVCEDKKTPSDKFCKEERTKYDEEKDEDSAVPKKKEKVEISKKNRRDVVNQNSNQLFRRDNSYRKSNSSQRIDKRKSSPEALGGFDVYNIETAMPKIDLAAIESHLRASQQQERKWRTDREEIRRRLAMGSDADDYYSSADRPGRKPSLQARLQSGMNLQICFMNESVSDNDSPNSECDSPKPRNVKQSFMRNSYSHSNVSAPTMQSSQQRPTSLHSLQEPLADADFFARQARLQTEARLALAQAKEMAHMQMEVERQQQQHSPIREMVRASLLKVGVDFPEERRRVSRQILTEMNVAQLQVIVNDLHTQIERLNETLVHLLMERDDLHMEQDSMLVDIEDLTRYLGAKEQSLKEQTMSLPPTNNNNNTAFLASATLMESAVKPRLNKIANFVKK